MLKRLIRKVCPVKRVAANFGILGCIENKTWIRVKSIYDQFASGYLAMGNDPVSNTDPDDGQINPIAIFSQLLGLLSLDSPTAMAGVGRPLGASSSDGADFGAAVGNALGSLEQEQNTK